MRSLIYVPIVHSKADLGALGQAAAEQTAVLIEADLIEQRRDSIEAMWGVIRSKMLGMPLAWPTVRIYQDGLPICGHEHAIVRDLAAAGSLNHRLLAELLARGATLMGTEEPPLLIREYRRFQRLIALAQQREPDSREILEIRREGEDLLVQRDDAIARRIRSTLAEGEQGVLFIGLLHRVDELIAGEVHIQHLIRYLPLGAEPLRDIHSIRRA